MYFKATYYITILFVLHSSRDYLSYLSIDKTVGSVCLCKVHKHAALELN